MTVRGNFCSGGGSVIPVNFQNKRTVKRREQGNIEPVSRLRYGIENFRKLHRLNRSRIKVCPYSVAETCL